MGSERDGLERIGTGVLSWKRGERISDRYGAVTLRGAADGGELVTLARLKEGRAGQLVAYVVEGRVSGHIGDLFRGFFPPGAPPPTGQKITLGAGLLFFERGAVGLRPDDGRKVDWLNPEALYVAHEQVVELYFRPDGAR